MWLISTLLLLVLVRSLSHELLTGVTYVQVPPGTAFLLLTVKVQVKQFKPILFFPPVQRTVNHLNFT